ncbi:MAG TPA: DUF6527 family protein [Phytomonospora sp.]
MTAAVRRADRLYLWCPGCRELHWVTFGPDGWTWNGDLERPTISPSILVRHRHWEPPVTAENLEQWKREPWEQHQVDRVCHSFVRDGVWEFLSDCTHELAGQHIAMADVTPEWPWDEP